jgi:hypothetical protein
MLRDRTTSAAEGLKFSPARGFRRRGLSRKYHHWVTRWSVYAVKIAIRRLACSSGAAGASGFRQLYDVLHF